jgi:hypothetical protein
LFLWNAILRLLVVVFRNCNKIRHSFYAATCWQVPLCCGI